MTDSLHDFTLVQTPSGEAVVFSGQLSQDELSQLRGRSDEFVLAASTFPPIPGAVSVMSTERAFNEGFSHKESPRPFVVVEDGGGNLTLDGKRFTVAKLFVHTSFGRF